MTSPSPDLRRLLWLAPFALAACSQPPGAPPLDDNRTVSIATAAPAPAAEIAPTEGHMIGGDGSRIVLDPLSPAEIAAARLTGELACGFARPGAAPMLIARGDVASKAAARGVVKVAGYIEEVAAPGGYDAMLGGAVFGGKGKTINVVLTGPAKGGGESPSRPATLTYLRADGASLAYDGNWTCGP